MRGSLEFLLGVLDRGDPPLLAWEDIEGPHRDLIDAWRAEGLVAAEPSAHPAPSCPHCAEGVPYGVGGRLLCSRCRSAIDPGCLRVWPVDRGAFLRWLSAGLGLGGDARAIDGRLWQLGMLDAGDGLFECFYRRGGPLSAAADARLSAYRNVIVFCGPQAPPAERAGVRYLPLLELLRAEGGMGLADIRALLRPRGRVRFEAHSGALWVGDAWMGEVPPGSKEHAFLACLAGELDHFVPYPDIKRAVLQLARAADTTEEATFCQGLKSRIKKKYVPRIDLLVATTNKADGYRLRGYVEL